MNLDEVLREEAVDERERTTGQSVLYGLLLASSPGSPPHLGKYCA